MLSYLALEALAKEDSKDIAKRVSWCFKIESVLFQRMFEDVKKIRLPFEDWQPEYS